MLIITIYFVCLYDGRHPRHYSRKSLTFALFKSWHFHCNVIGLNQYLLNQSTNVNIVKSDTK